MWKRKDIVRNVFEIKVIGGDRMHMSQEREREKMEGGGCCESGDEPLVYIKCGEFLGFWKTSAFGLVGWFGWLISWLLS
jgi:hypothetical protein